MVKSPWWLASRVRVAMSAVTVKGETRVHIVYRAFSKEEAWLSLASAPVSPDVVLMGARQWACADPDSGDDWDDGGPCKAATCQRQTGDESAGSEGRP